jgi:ribose/xylose/arabinose/galactoside ABC-type transport system permease subunit
MRSLLEMKEHKRAQLGSLQTIIITLVVVGIVLGIGFLVLEEFSDQLTDGSDAQAGVNDTITALKKVPTWLSIIVILAIVGILLAIVFSVLPRSGTQV